MVEDSRQAEALFLRRENPFLAGMAERGFFVLRGEGGLTPLYRRPMVGDKPALAPRVPHLVPPKWGQALNIIKLFRAKGFACDATETR